VPQAATHHDSSFLNQIWFPVLISVAGLLAYSSSFAGPFVLDDIWNIVNNKSIRCFSCLAENFNTEGFQIHRPLVGRPVLNLTLAFNFALGGLNVIGYHILNFVIHIAAALTLFGLLRLSFSGAAQKDKRVASSLSFVVALFWMIHPLQTQAVTYVIQRGESMMSLFYLLTLYGLAKSAVSKKSTFWSLLAIFSCALGMGTKEVMVTAPIVALVYDRIFLSTSWNDMFQKRGWVHLCLFSSWAISAYLLHLGSLQVDSETAGFHYAKITSIQYMLTQPGVILHYLKLSFWPLTLCFDVMWPMAREVEEILPALLIVGALGVFSLVLLKMRPKLGFLGVSFFFILAPTSSVMPIMDMAVEHRMYLPLAVVLAALVLGVYEILLLLKQVKIGFAIVVPLALMLGFLTFKRNQVYANNVRLWQDTVQKSPHNYRAFAQLGAALDRAGDTEAAKENLNHALKLNARDPDANNNLGFILFREADFAGAITFYQRALAEKPDYLMARLNLGEALLRNRNLEEAKTELEHALHLDPAFEAAHFTLGMVLVKEGAKEEAVMHFREAIRLVPQHADAHNQLGLYLLEKGEAGKAILEFQTSVNIEPENPKFLNHLGIALAESGQNREAIKHFERAIQIDSTYAQAQENLARARSNA
jgi:protein O-mannosyl-transferase